MPSKAQKAKVATDVLASIKNYNNDYQVDWSWGGNWDATGTQFETYVNKYLFPKLNESTIVNIESGNRFNWLAKEVEFIGQYAEEYVIMDSVPVGLNLTKAEELMLKREYPRMATKFYNAGVVKKMKFTLNNNDVRQNFLTLGDAITYAMGVYRKKIADINVYEEKEMRAMLVDYGMNQAQHKRHVTSQSDFANTIYETMLDIQDNSELYNEVQTASGGAIGRLTTYTPLDRTFILTTNKQKTFMLNTEIGNTFQVAGLDPTNRIMSFNTLGMVYKLTEDVTIEDPKTITYLRAFGDYQTALGDVIQKDSVFTFEIKSLTEFKEGTNYYEIKPDSDLWGMVLDINSIRYRRNTKGMLKVPFYNPEFDEYTYWLHYYSQKNVSPFWNKVVVTGGEV